jgi:hypothetical protein
MIEVVVVAYQICIDMAGGTKENCAMFMDGAIVVDYLHLAYIRDVVWRRLADIRGHGRETTIFVRNGRITPSTQRFWKKPVAWF